MFNLNGKTALVIGGETGIGRAVSTTLARAGASVCVAGILKDEGQATVDAVRAEGHKARFSYVDVRDSKLVAEVVRTAPGENEGLDVLVYCAGVFDNMVGCVDTTEVLWDQLIDINLKGCFLANKAVLELMLPRRVGRIINLASIASFTASADGFPYTASKNALIGLTKHIARRYASEGINCNCVCPGVIETNIVSNTSRILGEDLPAIKKEQFTGEGWKKWVPQGRQGNPEEVADLVLFLAAGNSTYINGQAIVIDGGWLTA